LALAAGEVRSLGKGFEVVGERCEGLEAVEQGDEGGKVIVGEGDE
jgi:hypothetical protein